MFRGVEDNLRCDVANKLSAHLRPLSCGSGSDGILRSVVESPSNLARIEMAGADLIGLGVAAKDTRGTRPASKRSGQEDTRIIRLARLRSEAAASGWIKSDPGRTASSLHGRGADVLGAAGPGIHVILAFRSVVLLPGEVAIILRERGAVARGRVSGARLEGGQGHALQDSEEQEQEKRGLSPHFSLIDLDWGN